MIGYRMHERAQIVQEQLDRCIFVLWCTCKRVYFLDSFQLKTYKSIYKYVCLTEENLITGRGFP